MILSRRMMLGGASSLISWRAFAAGHGSQKANLALWKTAKLRVQGGGGNATVLCVGDSVTAGAGSTAGNSSMGSNAHSASWPYQLAPFLTSAGLNASNSSWIGGNGNIAGLGANTWTDYDSRIAMGAATNSGLGTLGSNVLQLAASGAAATFTPLNNVDTAVILGMRTGAAATINANGGSALATFTASNGAPFFTVKSSPVSLGSAGAYAIGVASAASNFFLSGVVAYNSAVSEVSVLGAGWYGAIAMNVGPNPPTPTSWVGTDGILAIAPDLTIVALTLNDSVTGTAIPVYGQALQNIITAGKASGDVLLIIEHDVSSETLAAIGPYRQVVQNLAIQNGCGVIDFSIMWGLYANWGAAWGSGDGTHLNAAGQSQYAQIVAATLMNV